MTTEERLAALREAITGELLLLNEERANCFGGALTGEEVKCREERYLVLTSVVSHLVSILCQGD